MLFEQFKSEFESLDLEALTPDELDELDNRVMGFRPFYTSHDPEKWEECTKMRIMIKAEIDAQDPDFYHRKDDERMAAHLRKITNPAFMKRRREMAESIGESAYGEL